MFPNIPRVDQVYGRVNLHKLYAAWRRSLPPPAADGSGAAEVRGPRVPPSADGGAAPFALGVDVQAAESWIEVLSGRNGSRLRVPAGDVPLLIEALRSFNPQSLRLEKPVLDLSE